MFGVGRHLRHLHNYTSTFQSEYLRRKCHPLIKATSKAVDNSAGSVEIELGPKVESTIEEATVIISIVAQELYPYADVWFKVQK